MDQNKVVQGNVDFFIMAVMMTLEDYSFSNIGVKRWEEVNQLFVPEYIGGPGYIKIDISSIKKKGEDHWRKFVNEVDLFFKVSRCFYGKINFEDDFIDKIVIEKCGYKFIFEIRQYGKDGECEFEIINFEDIKDIPENERLWRICYLEIVPL